MPMFKFIIVSSNICFATGMRFFYNKVRKSKKLEISLKFKLHCHIKKKKGSWIYKSCSNEMEKLYFIMNFCCRQKSSTMLTITFQCLTKNETKVSPRRQRGGLIGLTAQTNMNFLLLAPRQTVSIFCYFTRSTIRLTKFWYYFSPFPHVNCFYRYFSTFNIKFPCSCLCYSLIS